MQENSHADSHLSPTTKEYISACGDIAAELSINPFQLKPTWISDSLPLEAKSDMAISEPTDNNMCVNPSVSALTTFLLGVSYTLGLFKKGNFFPKSPISSVENAHSLRSEALDGIVEAVNIALEKYQDKPIFKKSSSSQFFSGNGLNGGDKKEEYERQDKVVSAKR